MTVSLLNSSKFTWDTVTRKSDSVGDYYNSLSGRVVVLVGAPSLVPYAFWLLDSLGTVNTSVKQLDVQSYTGSIPAGYDYAIVVAPPGKLGGLEVPLDPKGDSFSIHPAGGETVVYRAAYAQPFGVLELDKTGSTLVATYWKSAAIASGLTRIPAQELAAQTDDLFLFNAETATYSSLASRPRHLERTDPVRRAMLPILGLFSVILLALIAFTAHRARSAS